MKEKFRDLNESVARYLMRTIDSTTWHSMDNSIRKKAHTTIDSLVWHSVGSHVYAAIQNSTAAASEEIMKTP